MNFWIVQEKCRIFLLGAIFTVHLCDVTAYVVAHSLVEETVAVVGVGEKQVADTELRCVAVVVERVCQRYA